MKRRAKYINLSTSGESNISSLPRSILAVTALCLTLLLATVSYSLVKYMEAYRNEKSLSGGYGEQNLVKRQYIIPSAYSSDAYDEYRPDGYSENIGTALALKLERNRRDANKLYEVVIDTSQLYKIFDQSYSLRKNETETVYWSNLTAYGKYLTELEKIHSEMAAGNLPDETAQNTIDILRDEYAMEQLDYRNALKSWTDDRIDELDGLYTEIADGKYYAELLASEIYALADEGLILLGVGDERSGIIEEYEKYLNGSNDSLLWYLSRCSDSEVITVEYRIRYSDGHPRVPTSNLLSALEKRLNKADIASNCIDEDSVRPVRVQNGNDGYTAAVCSLNLTKSDILQLLDSAYGELTYNFTDSDLLAEYRLAVSGDGFAYRTELVQLAEDHSA